jgi:hypothetical protein
MHNKIRAAIARRSKDELLQSIIKDLQEHVVTCETALAALPRMCPEIEESHDARISLEVARKALDDVQKLVNGQLHTALFPPASDEPE